MIYSQLPAPEDWEEKGGFAGGKIKWGFGRGEEGRDGWHIVGEDY